VIGACQALVARPVSRFVIPLPSSVLPALASCDRRHPGPGHILVTVGEAATGFAIAVAIGLTLGTLMRSSASSSASSTLPGRLADHAQDRPGAGAAGLVRFGWLQDRVAAVISLFPVLVNTIAGLKNCDPGRLDACCALGASRWTASGWSSCRTRAVRLRASRRDVCLTGALVGEFVGARRGSAPDRPGQQQHGYPAGLRDPCLVAGSAVAASPPCRWPAASFSSGPPPMTANED
jgi:NitT/TauT family transport system permease protein